MSKDMEVRGSRHIDKLATLHFTIRPELNFSTVISIDFITLQQLGAPEEVKPFDFILHLTEDQACKAGLPMTPFNVELTEDQAAQLLELAGVQR